MSSDKESSDLVVYTKASRVILMLQEILGGQKIFFDELRTYLKRFSFHNVDQVKK